MSAPIYDFDAFGIIGVLHRGWHFGVTGFVEEMRRYVLPLMTPLQYRASATGRIKVVFIPSGTSLPKYRPRHAG